MKRIIKLEDGKEVKISEESYNELAKAVGKKDYSKFVGNHVNILVIKGEKLLKSYYDNTLSYGEDNFEDFEKLPDYEIVQVKNLKLYDVVCFYPEKNNDELDLVDFGIFVGLDIDSDGGFQILFNSHGIERLEYTTSFKNRYVVRFKR